MTAKSSASRSPQAPPEWKELPKNKSYFNFKSLCGKAFRITPRIVLPLLAGYYILGYAYVHGWMAAIDRIAMQIMLDRNMGYIAIGAVMPTVQWYAAWALRITAAATALVVYDLMDRIRQYCVSYFFPDEPIRYSGKNFLRV